MSERVLKWTLVGVAIAAALGFTVVLATRSADRQAELWQSVGNGLIQILVIGVLSTALKLMVDNRQAQRERAEQRQQFRQDKYDRLVDATNTLRRVPILIDANRSVKTWSEQMLAVIDAGLTLRMIKHQIASSQDIPDPPFPDHLILTQLFELMYAYTDWVTKDFANQKKQLSELQRHAEESAVSDEERARLQNEVWSRIRALPSVKDMLRDVASEERAAYRAAIEAQLSARADDTVARPLPLSHPSWAGYEAAESIALERIINTTLQHGQTGDGRTSTVDRRLSRRLRRRAQVAGSPGRP